MKRDKMPDENRHSDEWIDDLMLLGMGLLILSLAVWLFWPKKVSPNPGSAYQSVTRLSTDTVEMLEQLISI